MKIITLLVFIFSTLAFYSCQKEFSAEADARSSLSNKIKTYTEDLTVGGNKTVVTFNLNYDAGDRVISLVSTPSPGDKFLFNYVSNTSYSMDIYSSNVLNIHVDFFLTPFSLVDSTFQYNNTNDTLTEKYTYNSAKQLIRLREYEYSKLTGSVLSNTHNYLYDNSGNQVSETDNSSVTTLEYTNNINNVVVFPYYSLKPVYLIKTTTITSGGNTNTINHTYTFDGKNRVMSEQQAVAGGNEVLIKSYTYY